MNFGCDHKPCVCRLGLKRALLLRVIFLVPHPYNEGRKGTVCGCVGLEREI